MKFIENKEAVSPVVGVMLMLVVTLIIAGVVSAFGGGLVSTTAPTPQASITSSITFGDSVKIQHNGGDSIAPNAFDLKLRILTGDYADVILDGNLTYSKMLRTGDQLANASSFQTGDVLSIPWKHAFPIYYDGEIHEKAYKGDLISVSIYDKNSGKQISSQTVTVQ